MTKPARPDVRHNELIMGPEITVACGRCGDDMDYEDGFSCDRCGLDYGSDPGPAPTLMRDWEYYGHETLPEATADKPGHLLVWPCEDDYARPGEHAWVLHVGCAHGYTNGVDCDLGDLARGYRALDAMEVAEGIPFELADYCGDRVVRLLPGVYRIELTGVQLVPLRVAACVAVVDAEYGKGTHPHPDNLVELTAEVAEAAFRPAGKVRPAPYTRPADVVVTASEKFL